MIEFEPKDVPVVEVQKYLLTAVAPRPIALVSTISEDGKPNLSPFSFFNAFGANPPTIAFSPSRRIRDGSTKHTYENLVATKECVVNAVSYSMVQQVSLASTEYEDGINEFIKSGLKPIASDIVKPARVGDSPIQMECKLKQMINLGDQPGSGNMAICEIVKFHIDETLIKDGAINPDAIDLVGRNSANYYTRASGDAIFEIEKPLMTKGIGYDSLPDFIKNSTILTANNLGQLGNVEAILSANEVDEIVSECNFDSAQDKTHMEQLAKKALSENKVKLAWAILLKLGNN